MTLRSEADIAARANAGVSLFETLLALAILALILGVTASAFRGPSPSLRLQKEAATLIGTASAVRGRAIREETTLTMETSALTCDETDTPLSFFPDGTARGPDLCLEVEGLQLNLALNPLTARLTQVKK